MSISSWIYRIRISGIIPVYHPGYGPGTIHGFSHCGFLLNFSELVFPAGAPRSHQGWLGASQSQRGVNAWRDKIPGSGQRFLVFFVGENTSIFISHEDSANKFRSKRPLNEGVGKPTYINHVFFLKSLRNWNHPPSGCGFLVGLPSAELDQNRLAGGGQHSIRWLVFNSIVWNVEDMCILKCENSIAIGKAHWDLHTPSQDASGKYPPWN